MTPSPLVFDAGPLSHFAQQGWLGILRKVAEDRLALIPDVVWDEIDRGADENPHLRLVLDADWLTRVPIISMEETIAFAKYSERLAARGRNVGECGVLAVAECRSGEAVVDDRAARKAGADEGVQITGTVGLITRSIREGWLTVDLASTIADDLLASDYRLPFQRGRFAAWAHEQGLLERPGGSPSDR